MHKPQSSKLAHHFRQSLILMLMFTLMALVIVGSLSFAGFGATLLPPISPTTIIILLLVAEVWSLSRKVKKLERRIATLEDTNKALENKPNER